MTGSWKRFLISAGSETKKGEGILPARSKIPCADYPTGRPFSAAISTRVEATYSAWARVIP